MELAACANLAIPATGSRALYSLLTQHSMHAHHDENRLHINESIHCVLATLADPARRLEATVRFIIRHQKLLLRRNDTLVHALGGDLPHLSSGNLVALLRRPTSTLSALYRSSVDGLAVWDQRDSSSSSTPNGSLFLVAQTRYLRGVNCTDASTCTLSSARVVLLCTKRLDEDWRRLVEEARWPFPWVAWWRDPLTCSVQLLLGSPRLLWASSGHRPTWLLPAPALAPCNAVRWRILEEGGLGERNQPDSLAASGGATAAVDGEPDAANASTSLLSAPDAAFVREVLYPHDWALHQRVCRGATQSTTTAQSTNVRWSRGVLLSVIVPTCHLGMVVVVLVLPCALLMRCLGLACTLLCDSVRESVGLRLSRRVVSTKSARHAV